MKLKVTDGGLAEVKDGKPIYIHDDGTEIAFDAPSAMAKIGELNNEAKTHRLLAKELKEKLTQFEGIDDPAAAKKAMQFAQSMEGKKVMDDDGIKNLVSNSIKPFQEKITEYEKTLSEKDKHIYKLEVSNRFASSAYLKEKTIFGETPDVAEAYFAKHFKIEGSKVVAQDASGNQIFSRVKPGEPADFEEAISILIDSHPKKDHILKAKGASGSGAQGSSKGSAGENTMKRAEFDKLDPSKQREFSLKGGKLED